MLPGDDLRVALLQALLQQYGFIRAARLSKVVPEGGTWKGPSSTMHYRITYYRVAHSPAGPWLVGEKGKEEENDIRYSSIEKATAAFQKFCLATKRVPILGRAGRCGIADVRRILQVTKIVNDHWELIRFPAERVS
jgi:hypothetical protein